MDTFQNVMNGAPRNIDQQDLNNAIADQAKTILLQKKQIEYLVGVLSKTLAPQIAAQTAAEHAHTEEEVGTPVEETVDASAN